MRRQLGQALSAVLVITVLLTSSATAASPQDKLVGSGKFIYITNAEYHVSVSAQSGPSGEDARGQAKVTGDGRQFTAPVICLEVAGNHAITIAITNELFFPFPGATFSFIMLSVTDNGTPGSSPDDQVGLLYATQNGPPIMDCSFSGGEADTVVQGNFVITDAAP